MSELIDFGNYPTIFANEVKIQNLGDGLIGLVLIERRTGESGIERVIVGRIIRPIANAMDVAKSIAADGLHGVMETIQSAARAN